MNPPLPNTPLTHPLSRNEIQARATAFAHGWADASEENADAQSFWNDFFAVFGVSRRKVSSFEQRVEKLGGKHGRIDLLWKGTLLIEHKSRGEKLDRAYRQAMDYFPGLKPSELPRYVLVCDFQNFELHDLEPAGVSHKEEVHRFTLAQLPQHIHLFDFIAGYAVRPIRESDPINQRAVEAIGDLHDALKQGNYTGEKLEVFLVRLLFCLFADDTGIFQPKDSFFDLIDYHTREDGADVGTVLDELFTTLNDKVEQRQDRLPEHFARFPYVNGRLFEVRYRPPAFDAALRKQLLGLCHLEWGTISPAIFGAMFQTVIALDAAHRRRQLGAHYTSEANILKLLGPLCLDELRQELKKVRGNKNQLFEFHKKLRSLTFLDPACGCGNFLVVAYRALRELELDVLRAASQFGPRIGSVFSFLQVNVDQFYGIEIEEFPAQIAQVAMWLTDHQMNLCAGVEFGEYISRIPLTTSAYIRRGNALEIDWSEFVPPQQLSYILGNPPFVGKQNQDAAQKTSLLSVTQGIKGAGVLDFVAGWYIKAAQYISSAPDGFGNIATRANPGRKGFADVEFGQAAQAAPGRNSGEPENAVASSPWGDLFASVAEQEVRQRRAVRCAFVSTNSICQGEQVGVLWGWMLAQGVRLHFAHRTFQWSNDAPGKAAVHCVIVGFGMEARAPRLFDYGDIQGEAREIKVQNLNPYLVDAPTVLLPNRRDPICEVSEMIYGSKPTEGGNLLLSDAEKNELLQLEPKAQPWIKRFMGAEEFLNNTVRWCLWLKDCPPQTLKAMPHVLARIERVRKMRLMSSKIPTQKWADRPSLFSEDRQPTNAYLLVPSVSSETRRFIPIGFLTVDTVASNLVFTIPNATLYEFGILSATMHNAWVRYTCGRLKSDFRYSAGIVYNNYPWPDLPLTPLKRTHSAADSSNLAQPPALQAAGKGGAALPLQVAERLRQAVEVAAQGVLDARAVHQAGAQPASLATLYNPNTMPANLLTAHKVLDKAVDAAYAAQDPAARGLKTDADRVAFLFTLYQRYTQLL